MLSGTVYSTKGVPGLDLPHKLRRAIGRGKIVPREVIADMMAEFDGDKDGALLQHELAAFLKRYRVGALGSARWSPKPSGTSARLGTPRTSPGFGSMR